MSVLAAILRPARPAVAVATLAGVVSGASSVVLIALVRSSLVGPERPADPGRVATAFAGLCSLAAATRLIAQRTTIRLAHRAAADLAVQVCRRVLHLPLERFEGVDHAQLLAVLTEDIGAVATALAGFPMAMLNGAILVICLAYVGWLAPPILAWGLLFAAIGGVMHHFTTGHGVGQLRQARIAQDSLIEHYRGLIGGFRELKQHQGRREAFVTEALVTEADAVRERMVGGLMSFAMAAAWSQFAFFGFVGFVIFGLARFAAIEPPALAGAVLALLYSLVPLDIVLVWASVLARARVSLARIEALMPSLAPGNLGEDLGHDAAVPLDFADSIQLDGARFTYPGGSRRDGFAIGPVDLTIHPGEIVVVAGGNGSGKTTLMKLLAGLYEPAAGRIRLDGRPIGPGDREAYRQLFSVVFADGHLFREVRGVDPVGLLTRAASLLDRLGLAGVVEFDGARFSTVDLSQGQRRRLALLAACLEDRPICLFDEWAANQDPTFKRIFYREILPELRAAGRTLIVISHDDDYLDVADRVIRLRDGQVFADIPTLARAHA